MLGKLWENLLRKNTKIWAIIWLIVAIYLFIHLLLYIFVDSKTLILLHSDDAYYYYKISSNYVNMGFLSFDSIHMTNGFHPLWFILLCPIFKLGGGVFLPLRIIGILTSVLMGFSIYISLLYLKRNYSLIAVLISFLGILGYVTYFNRGNMETSILIPLCLLVLFLSDKWNIWELKNVEVNKLILVGVIMAFAQMARLDAIFLNLMIVATLIITNFKSIRNKAILTKLLAVVFPSLISGFLYLSVNYILFGHLLPVSGAAKSLGAPGLNLALVHQIKSSLFPNTILSLGSIYDLVSVILFALCIVYILVYVVIEKKGYRKYETKYLSKSTATLALIVSLFYIIYISYYLLFSSWRLWEWYFYPSMLVVVCIVPRFVELLLGSVQNIFRIHIKKITSIISILLILCALLFTTVIAPGSILIPAPHYDPEKSAIGYMYGNYVLAQYVNENFSEDTIFAMGDCAGSFGYFCNCKVIQLEGLVNDYDFLDTIRNNEVESYLTKNGVDYVVAVTSGLDANNYTMYTISPNAKAKIRVYKECKIYFDSMGKKQVFVWSWPCCDKSHKDEVI